MTNARTVLRSVGCALAAGFALAACSDLSINERIYKKEGASGFRSTAMVCYAMENGSTGTGGGNADFWHEASSHAGVLTVEVRSRDVTLASRRYDVDFARSGKRDEFQVVAANGDEYLFRYWGSNPCQMDDDLGAPP